MADRPSPPKPAPCEDRAPGDLDALLALLRRHAEATDESSAEVAAQLGRMAAAGVMRWGIPVEYGGCDLSAADQTEGLERLAAADLVSTFVLTQRNAAVSRIAASDDESLKSDLLPPLAAHEVMATVGISHLTTSRQHLNRPAVAATPDGDGYLLDGVVPWVTAAAMSDVVLTGGTLSDGRQLLVLVPTDRPGVTVAPPPPLLALNGSQTGPVSLRKVRVEADRVVARPVAGVMKQGAGGTGSVTTSALAVGAAAGVLEHFDAEAERRPELQEIVRPLAAERAAISADIRTLLESPPGDAPPGLTSESIRQRANSLALRTSQAYLAASKGAGFVKGHPAERAVREAMFFLVWSCPQPVVNAALREFACLAG
ncbi:MAG TPA: acyl-CoA dehydrogenase family protein [Planctomycetaceae bacterium]